MIEVVSYTPEYEHVWEGFVPQAKNGHFICSRRYLRYHADRFKDASLLFYKKQELLAVLPAHQTGREFISHGGLTFGGLVMSPSITLAEVKAIFTRLVSYLKEKGYHTLRYHPIPACYHRMPACEDLGVLHQFAAIPARRDVISVINLDGQPLYNQTVRWAINRAKRMGMHVRKATDFAPFMKIVTALLEKKYQASPVHTLSEMNWLAHQFPGTIQLQEVYLREELLGGMLLYVTEQVVHVQYTATTSAGRKNRALPYLVESLVQEFRGHKRFLSLGTSKGGGYVHESLYEFKESLGARAMLQEQFVLPIQ